LRAVARADLVLTLRSACAAGPLALKLVEARAQDLHCKPAILMLRLFCRDDDDAGRQVREAHRRFGLVDVLASRTAGPHAVDTDVSRFEVQLDLFGLRQYGDGGR